MIIQLLRVRQWYKNLLIFLPIIFGQQLGDISALLATSIGFFSLCFLSSANYIINDILDQEEDKNHPEKRNRPIASGKIRSWQGAVIAATSLIVAFALGMLLSREFLYVLAAIFVISQLYTFVLKKEVFADILAISIIFVARAVSGAYVITIASKPYIWISPWLILCPFFLSLFMAAGKREADVLFLGEKAIAHRKVLASYSRETTKALSYISTTLLIISYSLYSFLGVNQKLIYTLPFALYVVFRYLNLIETGNVIARHPELVYKDGRLMIAAMLWFASVLAILY